LKLLREMQASAVPAQAPTAAPAADTADTNTPDTCAPGTGAPAARALGADPLGTNALGTDAAGAPTLSPWELAARGLPESANLQVDNKYDALSLIHAAVCNDQADTASCLLTTWSAQFACELVDLVPDARFSTLMEHAVRKGYTRTAVALLHAKARLNGRVGSCWSPLMEAARRGHADTMRMLLCANAGIDLTNCIGRTALMFAADEGHAACVQMLVDANADVNRGDDGGHTALMSAAYSLQLFVRTDPTRIVASQGPQASLSVVSMLLAANANVDARDANGRTPLAFAAVSGNASVMSALLAAKAIVHAQDENGETPLSRAVKDGHKAVVAALRRAAKRER